MADRYEDTDLRRGSARHDLVERLQRDLLELGFATIGQADGVFGRFTMWAVREFQAYASMLHVATVASPGATIYADRLGRVETGADRYTASVSGVVDAATRKALQTWLDNRWRCPVVVEAWTMAGKARRELLASNLWLHDQLASSKPRMFAIDLSDHFGHPDGFEIGDRMPLGDFVKFLSWSGPRSVPPSHTVAGGELLPERLAGVALQDMTTAQRSTYKVVRAVSEVECLGFSDSVNGYDNALISAGPCHWTLGIVSPGGNVSEGELCATLAYLKHAEPQAHAKLLGSFGIDIDEQWEDGGGDASGRRLFDPSSRKYTGWVALCDETGTPRRLVAREDEADYFKTWHWFYRFVAAGRTLSGYRRAMWDMARVRLRDIAATPLETGQATIGEVFTSERARAVILRWHIRFPGHVVSGGRAGSGIRSAWTAARASGLDWTSAPAGWRDAHEAELLRHLLSAAKGAGGGLGDTISYVESWPGWAAGSNPRRYALHPSIGRLATARGSFEFDATGLPAAP